MTCTIEPSYGLGQAVLATTAKIIGPDQSRSLVGSGPYARGWMANGPRGAR
jgi:hypothetical protein